MKVKKKAVALALGMAMMLGTSITAFAGSAAASGTFEGYNYAFSISCSYNSATATTTYKNPENDSVYVSIITNYTDAAGDTQYKSNSASNSRGDISVTASVTENTYQLKSATSTHRISYNNSTVSKSLTASR